LPGAIDHTVMEAHTAPALVLHRIACVFPGRNGAATYSAVADTNLEVGRGEFVALVGPTGCGKSTLLNVAAGLIAPSAGSVSVFGKPLSELNRHAGYLFQTDSLMPWRTARENIALGLELRGLRKAEAGGRADEWIVRVGLNGHEHKYQHELSGGMRKRVALAQTLILEPKILLMDEPFSALDVQTRSLMENELLALWSQDRKSVIFVTHDIEEAIALSDRVVVLSAGPASRPLRDFRIDLPRPRDVSEVRLSPHFLELHSAIWHVLKQEVLKMYRTALA
jgi:NitT/TauT family transport system ATP-binding protein